MAHKQKFKAGDWVEIIETGDVHLVHAQDINDRLLLAGLGCSVPPALVRKLPASPATLAKSHRLLMRWYKKWSQGYGSMPFFLSRHCRRIAKGKGGGR